MDRIFTAGTVTRLTGYSYQQLDRLARTGVAPPSLVDASGRGSRRIYTEHDVVALLLRRQLEDGVSGCMKALDAYAHAGAFSLTEGDFAVATEIEVIFQGSCGMRLEKLVHHPGLVSVIPLAPIRQRLQSVENTAHTS
ncbi:MAG: hypothetical protein KC731_15840 [Myxococcales bacterium]|nr:hypothetical protein [Myxococcales bacterium]